MPDNQRKLLLIDDEPDMVEVMFSIIDSRETRVLLAPNGHEALKLMKTNPVDAVLTDIRMPEMSGVELVRQMRARGLSTPVVMMTGCANLETTLEAMRAGVLDVIEKPFSRENMVTTLNHALKLGQSVRRIQDELSRFFADRKVDASAAEMVRYFSVFLAQQEIERARLAKAAEETGGVATVTTTVKSAA